METANNHRLIESLLAARMLRSEEEVRAFDQALAGLAVDPHTSDLAGLFRVFTDATEDPSNVMWGLVHLAEAYEPKPYAHEFVASLPATSSGASEWMRILTMRQLNDDEARELLTYSALQAEPAARSALIEILRGIAMYPQSVSILARDVLSTLGAT